MPEKHEIDYSLIPDYMRRSVKAYLEEGIKPGSFLTAILENNLTESIARADSVNLANLINWARFLYDELPMGCWGSKEKVKKWIEIKQLERLSKQEGEQS